MYASSGGNSQTDLSITKIGTGNFFHSLTHTSRDDTIDYFITYDNIGSETAHNVVIEEIIPIWTCYIVGTLEANTFNQGIITYYDSGNNIIGTPLADAKGQDCSVKRFTITFPELAPFIPSYEQTTSSDWSWWVLSGFLEISTSTNPQDSSLRMKTIEWYEQQTFWQKWSAIKWCNAEMIDSDSDPFIDFFVFCTSNTLEIWENTWLFTRTKHTEIPSWLELAVNFLDIDNDGKIESIFYQNKHYVYQWGTWSENTSSTYFNGLPSLLVSNHTYFSNFADTDGDGAYDTVTQYGLWQKPRWILSGSIWVQSGSFSPATTYATRWARFLDLDNNGSHETLSQLTNNSFANSLWTYNNWVWSITDNLGTSYGSWVEPMDTDGDNLYETLALWNVSAFNEIYQNIWWNWQKLSVSLGWRISWDATRLNLDGNKTNDWLVFASQHTSTSNNSTPNNIWVTHSGSSWITASNHSHWSWQTRGVESVDFNQDGRTDGVAVINWIDNNSPEQNYFYRYNVKDPDGASYTSPLIRPTMLYPHNGNITHWWEIEVDLLEPWDTSITFSIVDSGNNIISWGLTPSNSGTIDISFVDPILYPEIAIQAFFTPDSNNGNIGPELHSFRVLFTMDRYQTPSFTFSVWVSNDRQILAPLAWIYNDISISSTSHDYNLTNNSGHTSHVFNKVDLWLNKQQSTSRTKTGDTLIYSLFYGNSWANDARNVVIKDVLPQWVSYVTSSSWWLVTWNNSLYNLTIPTLPAQSSGLLTIEVTVDTTNSYGSVLFNEAHIMTLVDSDINLLNNESSASVVVGSSPDLFTTVSCPQTTPIGIPFDCSVNYGSNGGDTAIWSYLTLLLDNNTEYLWLTGYLWWSCVYNDTRSFSGGNWVSWSHDILCTWNQFSTIASWFNDTMTLSLQTTSLQSPGNLSWTVVQTTGEIHNGWPDAITNNNTSVWAILVQNICHSSIGLHITTPSNNASISSTTKTLLAQWTVNDSNAFVTIDGSPALLATWWQFSLTIDTSSLPHTYNVVASNGNSLCEERYDITLLPDNNTTVVTLHQSGGWWRKNKQDSCPCGDYSPSYYDRMCHDSSLSQETYQETYCTSVSEPQEENIEQEISLVAPFVQKREDDPLPSVTTEFIRPSSLPRTWAPEFN